MKKVLVIDDEPYIAEIVKLFAAKLGYETDVSFSGDSTAERLMNGDYWAVFCDLLMPGLSGLEVFEMIREAKPELSKRFVLLTASIPDKKIEKFLKDKEIIFFRKPFNFEAFKDLFSTLEKVS